MGAGTAGSNVLGERIIVFGKADLVGKWGLKVCHYLTILETFLHFFYNFTVFLFQVLTQSHSIYFILF